MSQRTYYKTTENYGKLKITNIPYNLTTLALLLCFALPQANAQEFNNLDSAKIVQPGIDSLYASLADTVDTPADSVDVDSLTTEGPIETYIDYSAKDSIYYDVISGKVFLYGEAKVTYGQMSIEAAYIEYDMASNLVTAEGVPDSTGEVVGMPIFSEGSQTYNAEKMTYNMETQKGVINSIVTQQGDGYIQSGRVKKSPDEAFYAAQNIYTTCNLDHPHFGIRARKLKIVPDKYVISGPFNFELNDVPTPLGFAFGLFPFTKERNAGILAPQYGESADRGFYLRDGGFYLPMGDYMGLKLLGQIYSYGGWGLTTDLSYRKRYSFNGNLNFAYNKIVRQTDDLSRDESTDYWLRWSHSPQSKGSSRFSANLNVGSTNYNRNNSFNATDYISASFNSSVSYTKTFEGTPFSMGANIRVNQNVNTQITNMNPQANFAMRRIYPFKKKGSTSKSPLAQLNLSYSFDTKATITNNETGTSFPFTVYVEESDDDDIFDTSTDDEDDEIPDFFSNIGDYIQDAEYGAIHRIPISTNLTLLKYFQIAPSVNFNEYWFPKSYNYKWSDTKNAVEVDTLNGFARAYDYSGGASMSTRFYFFYYPVGQKVDRIRHMVTPSISYNYRPDFGDPRFGFYQNVQTDTTGTNFSQVSRYLGGIYGGPSAGRSSSVSLSLNNQLEAKVRSNKDSTDEYIKVPLLQSFGASTSYNFAADSFNLSNITFNARTTLFKNVPFMDGVSVNVSGTIDPYAWELEKIELDGDPDDDIEYKTTQRRINKYAWNAGQGIGSLNRASLNLSTSFSPPKDDKKGGEGGSGPRGQGGRAEEAERQDIEDNPGKYVDFNIPWSLRVQYTLGYSKQGFAEASVVQTMNFMGEVKLTEKWKVGIRSGYDFELKDFSFTSLNIWRDLHCWQMNLSWIPFGPRQSYNIDISVRSSLLQDLKLSKRNSWYDRL
ncbi:putative LPS assembly protein LptD [Flammeovirgaceae bacterium SG7u.111]|nr:putative LPS assembly protein LptD [Flammeovirgaceae bacterium SG7u.132]WPO38507.1 putative LPS assembly protein LptD [Flammeovirgaceae bacterium SG7u.111]